MFNLIFITSLLVYVNTTEDAKPNIIILLADDLGYGDLAPFGNKTIPTPNFNKLASKGLKFTHHLTSASLCTPSRSGLLTGKYPIRIGLASPFLTRVFIFVASKGGLDQSQTTFAKLLKKNNYSTALIGKWHLGNYCSSKKDQCHNPTKHGFDYFYGTSLTNLKDFYRDGSSVVISFFPLFRQVIFFTLFTLSTIVICSFVFDCPKANKKYMRIIKWTIIIISIIGIVLTLMLLFFQKNITRFNSILMRNETVIEQPINMETLTSRIVNESIHFINKNHQNNQRFLLMTSFLKVHTAHFPSKNFKNKSKHGKYGDCIMELDYAVGQIIDHLDTLKIRKNTFIYFSSDNGAHLEEYSINNEYEGGYNGNFKGGKGHGAIEGGIRTPTIVSWPNGENKENEETNVPTSQLDVFPTLAELVDNKENLPVLDGESFLDLLRKTNSKPNHERYFFHYCGAYIHGIRYFQDLDHIYKIYYFKPKFISKNEYKCKFVCRCYGDYVIKQDPPEIYNLAIDPYEDNPINKTKQPLLFEQLISKFDQALDQHNKTLKIEVSHQLTFSKIIFNPFLQPCCGSFGSFCSCKEHE